MHISCKYIYLVFYVIHFYIDNEYYYTLKDVIFFHENSEINNAEYRKKAVESKIAAVVGQDRSNLLNFLTGAIDTCPQIDPLVVANYNSSDIQQHGIGTSRAGDDSINDVSSSSSSYGEGSDVVLRDKFNELRLKHAMLLDSHINKSKTMNSFTANNNSNNNNNGDVRDDTTNKRKIQDATFHDSGDGSIDQDMLQFLEADRQLLIKLRADDIPAHNITTVLNTVGTVSWLYVMIVLYNDD